MKSRIFIIALALVFVAGIAFAGNMHIKPNKNNGNDQARNRQESQTDTNAQYGLRRLYLFVPGKTHP